MDTETSINRLRAQFLSECPDKDLMRRIIRPYCPGHRILREKEVDVNMRRLYITPEGIDIFPELDSPPVSRNYMDNYLSNNKKTDKDNKSPLPRNDEYNSDSEAEMEKYRGTNSNSEASTKAQGLGLHHSSDNTLTQHNDEATSPMGDSPVVPILSATSKGREEARDDQDNVVDTDDLDSDSDDSDDSDDLDDSDDSDFSAESKDSKKRGNSGNRKLTFQRIFKAGRKENTDSSHKSSSGRKKSNSTQASKKQHDDAFDMNFGYEHGFEESDEDEDEDEDENSADLHSQFFQLDTEVSKNSNINEIGESELQSYGNNNLNYITSTSINGNVTSRDNLKRKSHFPQNMIPRQTLLDASRNNNKSERLLKVTGGSNVSAGNGSGNTNGIGNNNSNNANEDYLSLSNVPPEGNNSDDQGQEISDIESYINEQDLDNLNLDATPTVDGKSINSKDGLDIADNNTNAENSLAENGNPLEDSDKSALDSTYGKSLLDDSDFSGDNVFKPVNSVTDSNSILDDDSDLEPETVSHSIPLSPDEYGIYHGEDDITLDTAFDKAVLNIKGLKPMRVKEKRQYERPISHSISNSKYSSSSNAKIKETTASSAEDGGDGNKDFKPLDNRTQVRTSLDSKPEKIITYATPGYINKAAPKNDWLTIEKTTDFAGAKIHDSQLSSLFKKKINPSGSSKDLLEYFSFVSGSKVSCSESTDLNVYIQESENYRRTPFNLRVRKSATMFEVIGFILFQYAAESEKTDMKKDGLRMDELQNPNRFCLKIVDEDGAPFEDDFGKLDRKKLIQTLSDNEVVLCRVSDEEMELNEKETPIPFNGSNELMKGTELLKKDSGALNQLSYYKPMLGRQGANDSDKGNLESIEVKVYLYPNTNKLFNFTNIKISVTSSVNDILIKYCKMKCMDPNDYIVKIPGKKLVFNLNDTVLRLDGNYDVEIISKKEARELKLEKLKPDNKKLNLPTIRSNDLTPLTLEPGTRYLKPDKVVQKSERDNHSSAHRVLAKKKLTAKHKLGLATPTSIASGNTGVPLGNAFFKSKNNSKTSLQSSLSYYAPNRPLLTGTGVAAGLTDNGYQDLFSGAYHKYRVWRRQQMSLMNKHERTLALDGDYIYIVPPENYLHWHENVKTKSLHISQVVLCKKSKRVPEYFKIFFKRGQDEIKRYYFEAVSQEECIEIVSRIQNLASAYKMNHK